jgi:hypothetical protein
MKGIIKMEPKAAYEILTSKANLEDNVRQALLDIIKKDPEYAYRYAKYVIKGRFIEAEDYIKKDSEYAYKYAHYIVKGRWNEAEPYIIKDPYWAYEYALDVIKGRFTEAEEYIKKDPRYAYRYAIDVIKGRWIEAEDIIKKDTWSAYHYANNVIKDQNFWKNQELLADFMKSKRNSEPKPNSELDDLKKQREELDKRIKQLECV